MNETVNALKALNCACRAVKCLDYLKKGVMVFAAALIAFNLFKAFKKKA